MNRHRIQAAVAALALLLGLLLTGSQPSTASSSPTGFSLPTSLDLHDGMVANFGGTYYAYGEEESCGFSWYIASTPWCGLGVSTAPSLSGPWSAPVLLFDPNSVDPWTGTSWQTVCGGNGLGCFNPRMIQRSGWGANDGVMILWFNSPQDWTTSHANAYNAMGCNGPAGPCGPGAGAPHGSYAKPSLADCGGNGDFGFILSGTAGQAPAMICTEPGAASLSIEQLNWWGVGGGSGSHNVAGLSGIEGPGGYYDGPTGKYVITYADGNCGYCTGTATGYATSSSLMGPYTTPADAAAATVQVTRRDLTANTCGGQPRTVSVIDGQAYQGIDLWIGARNETTAGNEYQPLVFSNPANTYGRPWQPFDSWDC